MDPGDSFSNDSNQSDTSNFFVDSTCNDTYGDFRSILHNGHSDIPNNRKQRRINDNLSNFSVSTPGVFSNIANYRGVSFVFND
jgi:hypothetical protein